MHDPFFLPPPFTPSHPYFHDLTARATAKIEAQRQQTEREIREYIEEKRREIDRAETSIRFEVESAWKAFELANRLKGINVDAQPLAQPSSSAPPRRTSFGSTSRPRMNASPSPAAQVSTGFPPSLLSASLSANAFVRPDWQRSPRSPQDLGSNPITAPYHASKVDLDVAASLRVSNMPEFDRQENNGMERRMRRRSGSSDMDPIVPRSPSESQSSPRSKNGSEGRGEEDIELNPFAASTQPSASSSYQDDERTPRTRTIKDLGRSLPEVDELETTAAKDEAPSSRKRVTFQEPAPIEPADEEDSDEADQRHVEAAAATTTPSAAADTVFDFEDHDKPRAPPVDNEDAVEHPSSVAESARQVESKLIALVAGDAPSHRAAWRNNKRGLWQALGRTAKPSRRLLEDDTGGDNGIDEENLSPYASSVPIEIALPTHQANSLMLEPKTSLTERAGVLVPPLKLAMRRTRSGSGSRRKPSLTVVPPTIPEDAVPTRNASVGSVPIPGSYESPTTARGPSSAAAYSLRDRAMPPDRDPGPALESVGEDGP